MTNEEAKARALILSIYEARRFHPRVSPSWLATEAMQSLDPLRVSHPLEYAMAHLQFRQLARTICAGKFEPKEAFDEPEQHDLFKQLQTRYPAAHTSSAHEPEYVLLELLTDEDVDFNIARLKAEALAKLAHADALRAWKETRSRAA